MLALALALAPAAAAAAAPPAHFVFLLSDDTCGPLPSPRCADTQTLFPPRAPRPTKLPASQGQQNGTTSR